MYRVSASGVSNYKFPESHENISVLHKQTTSGVDFAAAPFGGISGTVYSGETTLGNVSVYLVESPSVNTISDGDGKYALEFVAPGTYTVAASHDDYIFSDYAGVVVTEDETSSDIDFIGVALGRMVGKIVEGDMFTPIPGAHVWVSDVANIEVTDENGIYEIDGLPTGKYKLSIIIPTYPYSFNIGLHQ